MNMIIRAAQYAAHAHEGQVRKYNGRPYITHPIRVAGRVAIHQMATEDLVAAAFLHDVIEDCGVHKDTIHYLFGGVVGGYVESLTNAPREIGVNRRERKRLDRERISSISGECKVVKMIDRIDNLLEIDTTSDFAKIYAGESLLLLEVLRDADASLAEELHNLALEMV